MLFIYGRIILGTSVVIRTVTCSENNYLVRLASLGLAFQSYFYINRMIKILRQRTKEYSERKKKGIKLRWLTNLTKQEMSQLDYYNTKSKISSKIP